MGEGGVSIDRGADALGHLIVALESAWLEPEHAELAALAALLVQRQNILTAIQKADASALDPQSRRALVERIAHVRERDARLVGALEMRRIDGEKQLDDVVHARKAARCYRAAETDPERAAGRVA